MIKGIVYVGLILVVIACKNETKVSGDGKTRESKKQQSEDSTLISPAQTSPIIEGQDESISVPANIAGAFLACEMIHDPRLQPTERRVGCALQDTQSGRNIVLESAFQSFTWTFESLAPITATIQIKASSARFQAEYLLTASRSELLIESQLLHFKINTEIVGGKSQTFEHSLTSPFAIWQPLNGGVAPTQAILSGSEDNGTVPLSICRIHDGGQVIPGKLRHNGNLPDNPLKTICFAFYKGRSYQSSDYLGTVTTRPSDVLVMDKIEFSDVFEWVKASNGSSPDNAFTAGMDALGSPIFICRVLQKPVPVPAGVTPMKVGGEFVPGSLVQGASLCETEYQGGRVSAEYEVLTWKNARLKVAMDELLGKADEKKP